MATLLKNWPLLLLLTILASCSGDGDNYTAYFRGQVKNPRMPYLLFAKDNKVIDTIPLDKNNHFFIKFDSLTPGMYSFKHEPDYQYVYFEKNDSLTVSIDAQDFDKSIIFSGRGDRKNNFMIELFAMSDEERKNSYDVYSENFEKFKKYIDHSYAARKDFYEKRKKEIEWSDAFDFYASYRVKLNYYAKKEYYPYVHARRTGEDARPSIPKDFYDFRNDIDFNDKRLINFSPFVKYSMAMINNMAVSKTVKHGVVKENAVDYNINKLNIADSVFKAQDIKNQVLNNVAFVYLLEDQNIVNNKKFLERYDALSTDKGRDNEISKISNAIKQLSPGKKLPEIGLVNSENKPFDIHNDIEKETVLFFWTSCARVNLQRTYNKIAELKKQHPNVNFIAVNVDNEKEWKKNLAYTNADAHQLRAINFDTLREKWAFTKINRTIVLNPDGTIKNAFTDLLDEQFVKSL